MAPHLEVGEDERRHVGRPISQRLRVIEPTVVSAVAREVAGAAVGLDHRLRDSECVRYDRSIRARPSHEATTCTIAGPPGPGEPG